MKASEAAGAFIDVEKRRARPDAAGPAENSWASAEPHSWSRGSHERAVTKSIDRYGMLPGPTLLVESDVIMNQVML